MADVHTKTCHNALQFLKSIFLSFEASTLLPICVLAENKTVDMIVLPGKESECIRASSTADTLLMTYSGGVGASPRDTTQ